MIVNNRTQGWEREALEFQSFFQKTKGLMLKREVKKPALFPLDRDWVSVWNFLVFKPLVVVGLDEDKIVKEKKTLPKFPRLKFLVFKDCKFLIEDSLERKNKYEEGDRFFFEKSS